VRRGCKRRGEVNARKGAKGKKGEGRVKEQNLKKKKRNNSSYAVRMKNLEGKGEIEYFEKDAGGPERFKGSTEKGYPCWRLQGRIHVRESGAEGLLSTGKNELF